MASNVLAVRRRPRSPRVRQAVGAHGAAIRSDERAIVFLDEILTGETPWRLSDVQRLLELHTLVAIGHWHADGLDAVLDMDQPG